MLISYQTYRSVRYRKYRRYIQAVCLSTYSTEHTLTCHSVQRPLTFLFACKSRPAFFFARSLRPGSCLYYCTSSLMQKRLVGYPQPEERRRLWGKRSRAAVKLQPTNARCGIYSRITVSDALRSPGEVDAHNVLSMYPADLLLIIK